MKRKGFTLIELLVVVAIIAVLIALLLPAIGKAKIVAVRARCGTNMRAVAFALQGYFAENAQQKPLFASYSATYKCFELSWPVALAPFLSIPGVVDQPLAADNTGRYYAFVQQIYNGKALRSALFCPVADITLPAIDWTNIPGDTNYRWTPRSSYGTIEGAWYGTSNGPPTPDTSVFQSANFDPAAGTNWFSKSLSEKRPNTPVFGHLGSNAGPYATCFAVNVAGQYNYAYSLQNSGIGDQRSHGNVLPFAYLDGHVSNISASEILSDYLAAGGVASGTTPTTYSTSFSARFGPNGDEPLYIRGTNSSKLAFTPW